MDIAGINHQTWVMMTVREQVERHYRVGSTRESRFVAGWSTGGYCAANLTSKYPLDFNAGFALAGYYHPTFEGSALSKATPQLIADNSPLARVKAGNHGTGLTGRTGQAISGIGQGTEHRSQYHALLGRER